ncbi:GTP-binding protein [Aquisalimonas lutea]|uniref:CobW family GTP-binding protein n=1 Tax=Aquisalimonas lutea TaxID=1327750 RepID=UPI0025B30896|nr:GTP-binding protein [Aquisalimonas lutea]MDN3517933.1 GTP-binding protein [Aquisalimonas lutea]
MSPAKITNVPTNLITGFLGVGKTTAVRSLLERAPAGQRWAVLVNEFGEVAVDQAAVADPAAATVRELPGGCLCCTLGAPLRVTLARLLREARPDRLLIEPTGVGHPARVLDVLREEGFAEALDVRATVCLVDPRRLQEPKVTRHETFRDQVELADVLIGNKADLCSEAELAHFRGWAAEQFPPKARVATTRDGALDPAWLDARADPERKALFPGAHEHGHDHGHEPAAVAQPLPGQPVRRRNTGQGLDACGWLFHPQDGFDRDRLAEALRGIESADRVKGVFRCGDDWLLFDRAEGALSVRASAWRSDSRVECIARADRAPDWDAVESALLACRDRAQHPGEPRTTPP